MFDAAPKPSRTRRTPLKSFRSLKHLPNGKGRREIGQKRRQLLIAAWFDACGSLCGVCGVRMVRTRLTSGLQPWNQATIDHIIARCLGGTNALSNLRVICHGCNNAKSHEENAALIERKRMYHRRAVKAARTRARNKARADEKAAAKAARKAYHKARSEGKSEHDARLRARARRLQWEAEHGLAA